MSSQLRTFLKDQKKFGKTKQKKEIDEWEDNKINYLSLGQKGLIPAFNKSVFQLCFDKNNSSFNFTTKLEETDDFLVIVPAGFRSNNYPTYNSVNPAMTRIGGRSALMSLVHILVISKKRKYSIYTLTKKDIPIVKEMQRLAKKWVKYLMEADINTLYSKKWVINGMPSKGVTRSSKNNFKIKIGDMSNKNNSKINFTNQKNEKNFDESDIETSFHTDFSIGWLHMHGFANNLLTTGYDEHYKKNIGVDIIIDALNKIQ